MQEEKEDLRKSNQSTNKNWIWWLFGGYVAFVIIYSIFFMAMGGKNYLLPSNELGDFLAGIVSPVAFLFLILGYLQQKNVIAENTKVLSEQMEELKLSKQLMIETNQPHFSFDNFELKHYLEDDLLSIKFKITNQNQNCTLQRLNFLEDCEKVTVLGELLRFLPRGESLLMQVSIKHPMDIFPPETMFSIEYIDIFGHKNQLFYVLQFTPNSSTIYIAPEYRVAAFNADT